MIRIVGLSATLPNYKDVALFLRVNLMRGLFVFDSRFRPVPLGMSFVGVKLSNRYMQEQSMNEVCYQRVMEQLKKDEQVGALLNFKVCNIHLCLLHENTTPNSSLFCLLGDGFCSRTG